MEDRVTRIAGMGGGAPGAVLAEVEDAVAAMATVGPAPTARPGTAAAAITRGRPDDGPALRLTAAAYLYGEADVRSKPERRLEPGTVVAVLGEEGDFYEVAADGRRGFILLGTPAEGERVAE